MTRRGWVLFAAMCLIWGLPYLLIRVAVRQLDPTSVVVARTAIGGALLLPFVVRPGWLGKVRGHWRALVAYTVVEVTVPWLLLTRAEQHITSSLSGLLVSATPLVGFALARLTGDRQRTQPRQLAGLLLGLGGVVALVGLQLGHV